MNKDFFKQPDFQKRLDKANEKLTKYLMEKEYEVKDIKVEELIQWHDESPSGPRKVYPHNDCPSDIRNIVNEIITTEFKTD